MTMEKKINNSTIVLTVNSFDMEPKKTNIVRKLRIVLLTDRSERISLDRLESVIPWT